ncbi:hypothetical protein KFL_001450100 [Klebsormidium nitens]|uniref:Uncharacterized protein n=1 Tax=Klebsormidium nitens TaxID=105231 RepID=A0A1Y1I3N0_KLENI|nr:hypothetical protein KFL_001450100 [Klebsormidium nitens]|eukprot:GAQ83357.1 hypothetical protein KFL_001450100 [Klebsormidium nitens]
MEAFPKCNVFLGFSPNPTSVQAFAMGRDPADPSAEPVVQTDLKADELSVPLAVIFQEGGRIFLTSCRRFRNGSWHAAILDASQTELHKGEKWGIGAPSE